MKITGVDCDGDGYINVFLEFEEGTCIINHENGSYDFGNWVSNLCEDNGIDESSIVSFESLIGLEDKRTKALPGAKRCPK